MVDKSTFKSKMDKPVIILGAGTPGLAAAEIFASNNVIVYCILDDDEKLHGTEMNEIQIMGSTDDDGYLKYIGKKCEAFIASDEVSYRKHLVELINERRKMMPVNGIHATAYLPENMAIGHGNMVDAKVVFGAGVKVGSHNIFRTGAIVDHKVTIGDYVQVGAGSVINSSVEIADEVFIGSGGTIVSGIQSGKTARIGAGSVVVSDVKAGETLIGNPARPIAK